jgi:16S rRNA (guanine966-N2)-methyltransferase
LNAVRIVGGEFRRRILRFPDSIGLRPTPDRVRETLFNWLAPYVEGARVLECFAGSGAVFLEALSRGASAGLALELDTGAARSRRTVRKRQTLNSRTTHETQSIHRPHHPQS